MYQNIKTILLAMCLWGGGRVAAASQAPQLNIVSLWNALADLPTNYYECLKQGIERKGFHKSFIKELADASHTAFNPDGDVFGVPVGYDAPGAKSLLCGAFIVVFRTDLLNNLRSIANTVNTELSKLSETELSKLSQASQQKLILSVKNKITDYLTTDNLELVKNLVKICSQAGDHYRNSNTSQNQEINKAKEQILPEARKLSEQILPEARKLLQTIESHAIKIN